MLDEMRIAQLKDHLKDCENEVNEARNNLSHAEVRWFEAYGALLAALEERPTPQAAEESGE